jgi:hypothetical protein
MSKYGLVLTICFSILFTIANSQVTPKSGTVKVHNGRPTIFINDQPVSPVFYAPTHAYGGRWSWEEVPQRNISNFCQLGVKLFQVDLYLEDIWKKGSDTLDMVRARKQVSGVLEVCPEASIVVRVHVNAPFWWNDQNPDEMIGYLDGPVDQIAYGAPMNNEDGDPDRPVRASLASKKWKRESGEKLAEFCRKLSQTREGASVIGIHVSGGVYGEWHYYGYPAHTADNGKVMTSYFREWLKNKYKNLETLKKAWSDPSATFENAAIPDTTKRIKTSFGILRNPAKEMNVIDYYTCQQEVVADDIEYFCKIVKDNWPRPVIVGVFYGYFFMTFSRQASGGHLFIERILNSPYIDYLSAPQSYWWASMNGGGPGHSRGVIESAILHGKLWLDEVDNGHLQNGLKSDVTHVTSTTDTQYVSIIRRSALHPLVRGEGFWYYDFGLTKSRGWWDNPDYLKNIKEEVDFFKNRVNVPYKSEADVLFVWDQESFYYVTDQWTPLSFNFLDQETAEAYHSGAVMDHIYVFDLPKANLTQYKAVVFMNVWKLTAAQKDFINKNVYKDGRTIIWHYLPGVTDGKKMSTDFVSPLIKMKIEAFKPEGKPSVTIRLNNQEFKYDLEKHLDPAIEITDKTVEPLGTFNGTQKVMLARKKFTDHTIIYSAVALHDGKFFSQIFKESGCHIWNESGDVTMAGSGLFWVHTVEGGKRELKLKNGKVINIELPKYSTTLFNSETGQKIF